MNNTKFKAGDKVRVKTELKCGKNYYMEGSEERNSFVPQMGKHKGEVVTISKIVRNQYRIIEDKEAWGWVDEMFEPVYCEKIVITTDGKTTLARLYNGKEVIKSAEAKLSKNDEFDFMTGAKLAMERLTAVKVKSNNEIKEGDIVKIRCSGLTYTTYLDWVEEHIVSRIDNYRYDFENHPDINHSFIVIKIAPHGSMKRTLAYIADAKTNRCYLFDIEGLKKA